MKKSTILLCSLLFANGVFAQEQALKISNPTSDKQVVLKENFSSGFLIYAGALTAGMGVIIGLFAESSGFLLTIPGAALIFAGIKSPNVLKNYKTEKNWNFELISTSE